MTRAPLHVAHLLALADTVLVAVLVAVAVVVVVVVAVAVVLVVVAGGDTGCSYEEEEEEEAEGRKHPKGILPFSSWSMMRTMPPHLSSCCLLLPSPLFLSNRSCCVSFPLTPPRRLQPLHTIPQDIPGSASTGNNPVGWIGGGCGGAGGNKVYSSS